VSNTIEQSDPRTATSGALQRRLTDLVENQLTEFGVPGAAVAVVRDGEVLLAKGFGLRDVERRRPVTAATLFPIASCTKAFTATLLGGLVDAGLAGWDPGPQLPARAADGRPGDQ